MSSSSTIMRKAKSTLHQSLDVSLDSLKPDVDARSFSCDVSGRYAVLGDSAGLLLVVRTWGAYVCNLDVDVLRVQPVLLHFPAVAYQAPW